MIGVPHDSFAVFVCRLDGKGDVVWTSYGQNSWITDYLTNTPEIFKLTTSLPVLLLDCCRPSGKLCQISHTGKPSIPETLPSTL